MQKYEHLKIYYILCGLYVANSVDCVLVGSEMLVDAVVNSLQQSKTEYQVTAYRL